MKQINQWSCGLACVVWFLNKYGMQVSQNDLLAKFDGKIEEWDSMPGYLDSALIIWMMQRMKIPIREFLQTTDIDEGSTYFLDKSQNHTLLAGFVIHRNPTNHCLAIDSLSGQSCSLMNPSVGTVGSLSRVDLQNNNPEILILAK